MRLPSCFDSDGLLPPGDYHATFDELRQSILVGGAAGIDWDSDWRAYLVDQAELLVRQLWQIGVQEIFLDGSFAEDKAHPNDVDGYFECDVRELATGNLQRKLNLLDAHKIWTWDQRSRRAASGTTKKQLPMWHVYRVELYPHTPLVTSGIVDEHGIDLPFPAAFRRHRPTGKRKGIVKIVRSS